MTTLWQRGRVVLVWPEQHEMHGLEVVMRRRSLAEANELMLTERPGDGKDWADLSPKERVARAENGADDLADLIVSWNFADDYGNPVPHTAAGILAACDNQMINAMWETYNDAIIRVSPPLPKSSEPGPDEWDLPPQETLSP
jgi:hypothetical protein